MATTTETIEELIKRAGSALNRAKTCHPAMVQDYTLAAITNLLEIAKSQEQRNQRIASVLDQLANEIGYPVNSIHKTRENIRTVARFVRGE